MSGAGSAPKQQLKLKLRQSPGSDRNTPGRNSATPSIIVDSEALQRQQRHVLEGMNGNKGAAGKPGTPMSHPFTGARGDSTTVPPLSATQMRSAGSPAINGVRPDMQSPALSATRPGTIRMDSQGSGLGAPTHIQLPIMAPPHTLTRPTSGSPLANGVQQAGYNAQPQAPTHYIPPNTPRVDSLRKVPLESERIMRSD